MNLWSHCIAQNMNEKVRKFYAERLKYMAELFYCFQWYFGQYDNFIHWFWKFLTFAQLTLVPICNRVILNFILLWIKKRQLSPSSWDSSQLSNWADSCHKNILVIWNCWQIHYVLKWNINWQQHGNLICNRI